MQYRKKAARPQRLIGDSSDDGVTKLVGHGSDMLHLDNLI